jgi:hypothetical protein
LHRVQVAKLEAGQHIPTWPTVQAIANALGVDCKAFEDDVAKTPRKQKGK